MGLFKNLIEDNIQETKPKVESTKPNWSNTVFDKNVLSESYDERHRLISQKFMSLIVTPDEDSKKESDEKSRSDDGDASFESYGSGRRPFVNSKIRDLITNSNEDSEKKFDEETKVKKQKSNDDSVKQKEAINEEEENRHFDYDPSDRNQALYEPDLGELLGSSINQLEPDQIAEEVINTHNNKHFSDAEDDYSNVQQPKENYSKLEDGSNAIDSNDDKQPVVNTREEYRKMHQQKSKENQAKNNDFSTEKDVETTNTTENPVNTTSNDENDRSLDSLIPPEPDDNSQMPVEELGNLNLRALPKQVLPKQTFEPQSQRKTDVSSTYSTTSIISNVGSNGYKPMQPTKEDKEVIKGYKQTLAQRIQQYIANEQNDSRY